MDSFPPQPVVEFCLGHFRMVSLPVDPTRLELMKQNPVGTVLGAMALMVEMLPELSAYGKILPDGDSIVQDLSSVDNISFEYGYNYYEVSAANIAAYLASDQRDLGPFEGIDANAVGNALSMFTGMQAEKFFPEDIVPFSDRLFYKSPLAAAWFRENIPTAPKRSFENEFPPTKSAVPVRSHRPSAYVI